MKTDTLLTKENYAKLVEAIGGIEQAAAELGITSMTVRNRINGQQEIKREAWFAIHAVLEVISKRAQSTVRRKGK